jgi:hypothetical protein
MAGMYQIQLRHHSLLACLSNGLLSSTEQLDALSCGGAVLVPGFFDCIDVLFLK